MSQHSLVWSSDLDEATRDSLTSEGTQMLERLEKLEIDDFGQQSPNYRKARRRRHLPLDRLPEHESLVLQERYEYRRASVELLKQLILKSEIRTSTPATASRDEELAQQTARARRQRLDQLERDHLDDQAFIDNARSQLDAQAHIQREQQIAFWTEENHSRQEGWLKAMRRVLEFKAKLHTQREKLVASVMNGIAQQPSELLLAVVEACVRSHFGHLIWSVRGSTGPEALSRIVDKCFKWPNDLEANVREMLKLEASKALIKISIIKIPMVFSTQNTIVVPPMLVERQDDLRRLVVNLNTMPYDGHYNRELDKSIKSIPVLGEDFPNLKVLVLSIYFYCSVTETREYKARFQTDVLKMQNFRQAGSGLGWEYVSIEHTLVELTATLARLGPGVRAMVRFGHMFKGDICHVGPLVQVTSPSIGMSGQTVVSDAVDETSLAEDPVITNARNVFTQAYYAPRDARPRHH